MTDLRYPIGECVLPERVTSAHRDEWIQQIADAPSAMRAAVARLGPDRIDTPYRPGGWIVRQVVHHVPDSHLHAYSRFKLALTENNPTIKPYDEARWAELSDSRTLPPDVSLTLLDALHTRWTALLRSLRAEDFARTFHHPEFGRALTLDEALGRYAWHGRHHAAHVASVGGKHA